LVPKRVSPLSQEATFSSRYLQKAPLAEGFLPGVVFPIVAKGTGFVRDVGRPDDFCSGGSLSGASDPEPEGGATVLVHGTGAFKGFFWDNSCWRCRRPDYGHFARIPRESSLPKR